MERLKSVLADKIIEVSSESGESTKTTLDKINRFRDFAFACETLMVKYPRIEEELIQMIQVNDFDTRIASSRVNNIISVIESGGSFPVNSVVQTSIPEVPPSPAMQEQVGVAEPEESVFASGEPNMEVHEVDQVEVHGESQNTGSNYAASENVEFEYAEENKVKSNAQRLLLVAGVVVGIVFLYFAIKFVFHNWKTILIVLGVIAAIGGLLWFVATKKNNEE